MMRHFKTLIILAVAVAALVGCGPEDKQAQLDELIAQRDDLNEQIAQLEEEIAATAGNAATVQKEGIPVKANVVGRGNFNHFVEIQGTVESDNNIFVPAESSGVVTRIYVEEGDNVRKGQLLAELDGSIYLKNISQLETNLELATTVFERQERLWEQNIGSEIQYLQAKTNKESLEKQLETVREQYQLTKITAPISGTVDKIAIKEGEIAAAGLGAVRVVQLSDLKITASLSEQYVSEVQTGDTVSVEIPALKRDLKLTVSAVSKVIDPNNRTFDIEITIPASEKNIMPNMMAILTINDYTNPQAIVVPINTVQKSGDNEFLFVAEKQNDQWIARRQNVESGKYFNNRIEILSGLEGGEQLITFGYQNLANGDPVTIVEE